MNETPAVSPEAFGKDHNSLLIYCMIRSLDYQGNLDVNHLRRNPNKRDVGTRKTGLNAKGEYLFGTVAKDLTIPEHDDIDCLNDLQEAGLIHIFKTPVIPRVILTHQGFQKAMELCEAKQSDWLAKELN